MIISVRIIPNSKKPFVMSVGENEFKIKVDAPAREEKANKRLIEILAKYFHTSKSSITILKGVHSRKKLINIP